MYVHKTEFAEYSYIVETEERNVNTLISSNNRRKPLGN
jgi:hypothetical protein